MRGSPDAAIKAAARYDIVSVTSHEPSLEDIVASTSAITQSAAGRASVTQMASEFAWNAAPVAVDTPGGYATFKLGVGILVMAIWPLLAYNLSKPLVPSYGTTPWAQLVMLGITVVLCGAAIWLLRIAAAARAAADGHPRTAGDSRCRAEWKRAARRAQGRRPPGSLPRRPLEPALSPAQLPLGASRQLSRPPLPAARTREPCHPSR